MLRRLCSLDYLFLYTNTWISRYPSATPVSWRNEIMILAFGAISPKFLSFRSIAIWIAINVPINLISPNLQLRTRLSVYLYHNITILWKWYKDGILQTWQQHHACPDDTSINRSLETKSHQPSYSSIILQTCITHPVRYEIPRPLCFVNTNVIKVEKLAFSHAGYLAQKRLAHGRKLNHLESSVSRVSKTKMLINTKLSRLSFPMFSKRYWLFPNCRPLMLLTCQDHP